jgi:hypothetical protein
LGSLRPLLYRVAGQAEQLYDNKKLLQRILIPHPLANVLLMGAQPGAEYFGANPVSGGQPGVGAGLYYYFLLLFCVHC